MEEDKEQGSDRIIRLLNDNLDRIIQFTPRVWINQDVLSRVLSGCSAGDQEFGQHKIRQKAQEMRNANTCTYLAALAFMSKVVEATPEDEQKALAWYSAKLKNTPAFDIVDDEIIPTLTEFFEQQLASILGQFPAELHPFIVQGLRKALFNAEENKGRRMN